MKLLILRSFNFLFFIILKKIILSPFILENDFEFNFFDNKKRFISIFCILKKRKLSKLEFFNIIEIDINSYYYLIKNKDNKLFFIIINKIYNNLISNLIK